MELLWGHMDVNDSSTMAGRGLPSLITLWYIIPCHASQIIIQIDIAVLVIHRLLMPLHKYKY